MVRPRRGRPPGGGALLDTGHRARLVARGRHDENQHLDIGQGEVDFGACFAALERNGFDGILTSCVFAWEERAEESSRFMRARIDEYLSQWATAPTLESPR